MLSAGATRQALGDRNSENDIGPAAVDRLDRLLALGAAAGERQIALLGGIERRLAAMEGALRRAVAA